MLEICVVFFVIVLLCPERVEGWGPVFMFSSGESLHCFLVGWCTNKKLCYSNLWLVALHPCFQPASLNSPHHSPTQCVLIFMHYTVCYFTGTFHAVVRQISMLFTDSRVSDSWSKGPGFESRQELREKFLLQGQLSVLTLVSVSVPPPCYRSST